jgi:hypothetical protein
MPTLLAAMLAGAAAPTNFQLAGNVKVRIEPSLEILMRL